MNRIKAPAILDAVTFDLKLKPYDHFNLDNNVPVYTIHAGAQEVIMLEFVFYAGNWYEQQNMVAATTNFMLKNGTAKKSAFAINEHFEFYGAYLNRHCYSDTASLTLHCLTKHLPDLLPVVAELLTESVFPEEELALYKQNQKQRLEVSLKKSDFVAGRLIDEYIYGLHHPYGKYSHAADYDQLKQDQLKSFYRKYYTEGKCMLFVAGNLPADIAAQINMNFGHLPFNRQHVDAVQHHTQPAKQKKYEIINDTNGVQAAIRIAKSVPDRHHPDFAKIQILNNILGGYFGSRLMSNIREDKGYTYGIHSYLQNHIHNSAWMISTEVGREVCTPAVEQIYLEMNRLMNEPVGEDELLLVRNHMMGSILGELDGPFQIIARWRNYILNNLTEDYFYNSIQTIKTITSEDLKDIANKYLDPEAFYQLTVV